MYINLYYFYNIGIMLLIMKKYYQIPFVNYLIYPQNFSRIFGFLYRCATYY
jgi:hypothetical protein